MKTINYNGKKYEYKTFEIFEEMEDLYTAKFYNEKGDNVLSILVTEKEANKL